MFVDSKYAKVFNSDMLTRSKYDELYAVAVKLRYFKNEVSQLVNDNLLYYLEFSKLDFIKEIVKIDKFYPSTQICSGCDFRNTSLRGLKNLSKREWICPECGEVHDRDLNASRNILKEGLKELNLRNVGVASLLHITLT